MSDTNKLNMLFGNPIKFHEKVYLRIPTVEEVALTEKYGMYTQPLLTTTRQLFSSIKEVDELEEKFPTVWQMAFHEEGSQILAQMFGNDSGTKVIIDSLAYWTGLEPDDFKALSNNKIVNQNANWVLDEKIFNSFCAIVKDLLSYEQDLDLIAPKNMSDRQLDIWKKTYAGRMRNRQKSAKGMTDKILILSISMDAYIPLEEIRKMSIYHFNKLYEGLGEKEAYDKQWEVKLSPKFESKQGRMQHWKEKFKA